MFVVLFLIEPFILIMLSCLFCLFQEHDIEYLKDTEPELNTPPKRCMVMEQKETDSGMKDEPCNRYVECAGLCKYVGYTETMK